MKYLQQKKKTRQIIFFFFFAILANFYERAWLPKTLDLILIFGMLGLLHGSFFAHIWTRNVQRHMFSDSKVYR